MIATDSLSLVFVTCIVFAGAFIVLSTVLGLGHGHGLHLGGHGLHLGGHAGGLHVGGHSAHIGTHMGTHVGAAHTTATVPAPGSHVDLSQQASADTGASPAMTTLQALTSINLNAVLVFIFAFGLIGYILHNTAHATSLLAIIFALIVGLVLAAGVNVLYVRLFGEESGRLGAASSAVEGRVATVSIPIRENGLGEVIYMGDNGTRTSLGARSTNGSAIPRDADVVIIDYRDGIAFVQSWDDFVVTARS